MTTFKFNDIKADRLMRDLAEGSIVKLTKANGSAITVQDGNDIDEFGDDIYRFTIEQKGHDSTVKNVPINKADLISFLDGLLFISYEIVNA